MQVIPLPSFVQSGGAPGQAVALTGASSGDFITLNQGSCATASDTASSSFNVEAAHGEATLHVISGGTTDDATVNIKAQAGQDAKLLLQQGAVTFSIMHDGSDQAFVVNDGTTNLLHIKHGTGATTIHGNLTMGTEKSVGSRAMTVQSSDGGAELAVVSNGARSDALVSVAAAPGRDATIRLTQGTDTIEISHDGSEDKLIVRDNQNSLLTVSRTAGDATLRGDLTIGGEGTTGSKTAMIHSVSGDAGLRIRSDATASSATMKIDSVNVKAAEVLEHTLAHPCT